MRRGLAALTLLAVLAIVAGACAADGSSDTTALGASTTEVTLGGGTAPGDVPTTSAADPETTTTSDREVAPDFTLELGDGGHYTLSEGAKPVYLVFWAEW